MIHRQASIALVVALMLCSLAGCADAHSDSSGSPAKAPASSGSPAKAPACVAAIKDAQGALDRAKTAIGAFSDNLKANAAGPALGFALIGQLATTASSALRLAAKAEDDLAALSTTAYASTESDAATALREAADQLDPFAAAAITYSVSDTPATTRALNSTAQGALDGAVAMSSALGTATAELKAEDGNVCK